MRRIAVQVWGFILLIGLLLGFGALVAAFTNPYSPLVTAPWKTRAAEMGIEVVVTNDERNCGAAKYGQGGCFSDATPNIIYVSPGMSPSLLEYVALHELGHAWRYQHGWDGNECMADRLAAEWGAGGPFLYCDPP